MEKVKLIQEIYSLNKTIEEKNKEIEKLKEEIDNISKSVELNKTNLLNLMKEDNELEIEDGDLIATLFSKETIGYTSDKDVLNYLKTNKYNDLITVKTTETLNKNALKKALKTNDDLSKALEAMTIKTTTEYIVVTNKENHQKMLEHISENSKK